MADTRAGGRVANTCRLRMHETQRQTVLRHQRRIDRPALGASVGEEHPVLSVIDVRPQLEHERCLGSGSRRTRRRGRRDRNAGDEEVERTGPVTVLLASSGQGDRARFDARFPNFF